MLQRKVFFQKAIDFVLFNGVGIRYNNFRKLKSKQKKTWFAALW